MFKLSDSKLIPAEYASVIAPKILSASRSTDIPAFYSEWLISCIHEGWFEKRNPFNNRIYKISLENLKVIVFWTKNPRPMLENGSLDILDDLGIKYYFLYSLNNYDKEGIEKNVPPLNERIDTFIRLTDRIGREKVIWRFDPLLLGCGITTDILLDRICAVGDIIAPYTNTLIFSFYDSYASVERNLKNNGFEGLREFTREEMLTLTEKISCMNRDRLWNLKLRACSEALDLSEFGVLPSACINGELISKICASDPEMSAYLRHESKKDAGQRPLCNCIASTDTGGYNTCVHFCAYCYSNHDPALAKKHFTDYINHKNNQDFN